MRGVGITNNRQPTLPVVSRMVNFAAALVLVLDSSSSLSNMLMMRQTQGLAEALRQSRLVRAGRSRTLARIAMMLV